MYSLIREHSDYIIRDIGKKHVDEYDWLMSNLRLLDVSRDSLFKEKYKQFWAMNAARLSDDFVSAYFEYLEKNKDNRTIGIRKVCDYLWYELPTEKSLQFSFTTKLVHMINPNMPIYDGMIKDFYFLPDISYKDYEKRIINLLTLYSFLKDEQRRIIEQGLLHEPMKKFREHYKPQHFTDVKVIDSLIWGFVSTARVGFFSGTYMHS